MVTDLQEGQAAMSEKNKAKEAYQQATTISDTLHEAARFANDESLSDKAKLSQLGELVKDQFSLFKDYKGERAARKNAVAQRLQQVRKERGLMQKEVADRTGINVVTLSGYEIAKSEPNMEALVRLAEVYNVSLDYLMCRTNEESQIK